MVKNKDNKINILTDCGMWVKVTFEDPCVGLDVKKFSDELKTRISDLDSAVSVAVEIVHDFIPDKPVSIVTKGEKEVGMTIMKSWCFS